MTAKTLMIQGTSSAAGKSMLVTGLCRYFSKKGIEVSPFKAQNISNNAAVCPDGGEIGRAQAVQALAAGLEPTVDMNPILIKPEGKGRSQIIVHGKPWKTLDVNNYISRRKEMWQWITSSLDKMIQNYELVIIEGAGSPVELNLIQHDLVNMAVASYLNSPVFLVGDIDRGGVFAQLLGTYWLLPPDEQKLVKGLVINKFRGDVSLFADGVDILENKSNVPIIGVLPFLPNLYIPEEDAVSLDVLPPIQKSAQSDLDIGVIQLPRISNFDDFDPLKAEQGVQLRYIKTAEDFGTPDAIILPGSKNTIEDLVWLEENDLAKEIQEYADRDGVVVGICGGYQMLGEKIFDMEGIESDLKQKKGLGLLPTQTTFINKKATYRAQAKVIGQEGWLKEIDGNMISGYEIHMGRTCGASNWLKIEERNQNKVKVTDGTISREGRIWGCYLHGIFANHSFRNAWLRSLGWKDNQLARERKDLLNESLDRLTAAMEENLDMGYVENMIWEK